LFLANLIVFDSKYDSTLIWSLLAKNRISAKIFGAKPKVKFQFWYFTSKNAVVCDLFRGPYLYVGQNLFEIPSLMCFNENR
jgi:hypothetical protein